MQFFTVKYENKEEQVKRVPRSQYKDLIVLQQRLLEEFVLHNGAVGTILSNDANWDTLVKIGKMLPIIGKSEPGIDMEALESDLDQLTRVFFTQALDEAGTVNLEAGFRPSLLSELHGFDFIGQLGNAVKTKQEMELQAEMTKSEKKVQRKSKED